MKRLASLAPSGKVGPEAKEQEISLALEVGRDSYWVYDLLESKGIGVHLAHPKKTKAIASARTKNSRKVYLTLPRLRK